MIRRCQLNVSTPEYTINKEGVRAYIHERVMYGPRPYGGIVQISKTLKFGTDVTKGVFGVRNCKTLFEIAVSPNPKWPLSAI